MYQGRKELREPENMADVKCKLANSLLDRESLNNSYIALRHGASFANKGQQLVSSDELDGTGFGLIEKGKEDIRKCFFRDMAQLDCKEDQVVILTSPLSRCRDSAQVLKELFSLHRGVEVPVLVKEELRDRGYGEFEGAHVDNWEKLREADLNDPFTPPYSAESVGQMHERLSALMSNLESEYQGKMIIMVTHCDPIQVLEVLFTRSSPSHYSEIKELGMAEVKPLVLK